MDANDRIWFFYSRDIIYRDKRQSFKEEGCIRQARQEIEMQRQKTKMLIMRTKADKEKESRLRRIKEEEEE